MGDFRFPAVDFQAVDIMFGERPQAALDLLDQGKDRDEILQTTGNVLGVADANLSVAEGEICVLMGLSGAGKSTLLRAVNGLNNVSRGRILVRDGDKQVDVVSCGPEALRELRMHRIAMVFQQFALLPWRTVAENVGLGLELRGTPEGERRRIVREKLELVHLDRWAEKKVHELSGGMQQRVGLARAFATDADILLMDEPFSALDPLIRTHLQDELLQLQARLKKTILFVSHDLDEALKIGNRIAIMDGGRIVQIGRPEEIVLNPVNEYVANFVAHMNPLAVLRGESLMTPVAQLPRDGDWLWLDRSGRARVQVDDQRRVTAAQVGGRDARLVAWKEDLSAALAGADPRPAIVVASPDVKLRDAIATRYRTGCPVLMQDGDSAPAVGGNGLGDPMAALTDPASAIEAAEARLRAIPIVGVVGDREIYRGILRQSGLPDEEPPVNLPAVVEPTVTAWQRMSGSVMSALRKRLGTPQ